MTATGLTTISGAGGTVSGATFSAGTYALSESTGPTGYAAGAWNCVGGTQNGESITLGLGQEATCTIINDDQPGKIVLVKNTVGGNNTFNFSIAGPSASAPSITTVSNTGTTEATVDAGSYSAAETVPAGWDLTSATCTSGTPQQLTVPNGGTVTCTFTNTKRGHLIVEKTTLPAGDTTSFPII